MKKLLLIFIIGAVAVWFSADYIKKQYLSEKKTGGQNRGGVVVAVETGNVTKSDMFDQGVFSGSIEAESKFQVAPKISGRIKTFYVNIGDSIKNGDIVAELDDEELVLAVEQAEAALEIAKANYNESGELLQISKRELERVQTMRKQKIASEVEVENASADFNTRSAKHLVNRSQLRQSETSLAQAKLKLNYSKIDASWNGGAGLRFIAERFLNEGSMISANSPAVSVIDIDTLKVVIDVVERDYLKIFKDMEALVIPSAINGKTFKAKVSRVSPMLDEVSRQARIELTLNNESHELKPGMFVTVNIIYGSHPNAVTVPIEALAMRDNREGVFLVDEEGKKAKFVPVESGYRNTKEVEICYPKISGRVITLGQHLLEDGMSIRIHEDEGKKQTSQERK